MKRKKTDFILDRMATAVVEERACVTPNCGGKAKLRCPNCVKLGKTFFEFISRLITSLFQVYKMDRIFVLKIVLKVIGKNIRNFMFKRVCHF